MHAGIVHQSTFLNYVLIGRWLRWNLAVITCGQREYPIRMVHVEVKSMWLIGAIRRQSFVNSGTGGHSPPRLCHYLSRYWYTILSTVSILSSSNKIPIQENIYENALCKMATMQGNTDFIYFKLMWKAEVEFDLWQNAPEQS